jgi:hypothetical protein
MLRSLPSSTSLYIVMIVRFLWRNDAETNPVTDTNMRHISSNVTFLLDETIYVACLLTMLGGFLRQMSMNFKWYVYKETNDFTRNVFGFHVHLWTCFWLPQQMMLWNKWFHKKWDLKSVRALIVYIGIYMFCCCFGNGPKQQNRFILSNFIYSVRTEVLLLQTYEPFEEAVSFQVEQNKLFQAKS